MKGEDVFYGDEDFIYTKVPYCEFYIPMIYFDSTNRFAEFLNDHVNVLGVFNIGIFENGKLRSMETLNLPSMVDIYVYDYEYREVELSDGVVTHCFVSKYLKDAKIMQARIFDDDEHAKRYLQCICSGKLPSIIPYSKGVKVWKKNQEINGVDFDVPDLYLELIWSVCSRDPNDMSTKYAKVFEKYGEYGYVLASIRQICQYNSTFTALTFEDMDSMITSSLNKSRTHARETTSPVEAIIKF